MIRRSFLASLTGGLLADPERLLWVPGKKLFSIPRVADVSVILHREGSMLDIFSSAGIQKTPILPNRHYLQGTAAFVEQKLRELHIPDSDADYLSTVSGSGFAAVGYFDWFNGRASAFSAKDKDAS